MHRACVPANLDLFMTFLSPHRAAHLTLACRYCSVIKLVRLVTYSDATGDCCLQMFTIRKFRILRVIRARLHSSRDNYAAEE